MNDAANKILKKSLKDSFKGGIWKWLLGSFSTSAAFFYAGKNLLGLNLVPSLLLAGVVLFLIFFVKFLYLCVKNALKYLHEKDKESVYGDAIIHLKDSFGRIHAHRKKNSYTDEEFMEIAIGFCNNLKLIFDQTTKSECAVSIKVPSYLDHVDGNAILHNLCRDSQSRKKRNTPDYLETKHTIIGNTCFSKALNNVLKGSKSRYYLNNDIPNTKDYENTSRGCYGDTDELPYKSELVHALIPLYAEPDDHYHCLGFLCVDSNKVNAFDDKYSVAIVEGVADGLYDLITERNQNHGKQAF
jgi:hypothetical protein